VLTTAAGFVWGLGLTFGPAGTEVLASLTCGGSSSNSGGVSSVGKVGVGAAHAPPLVAFADFQAALAELRLASIAHTTNTTQQLNHC
jgi:hypothetical protein